MRYVQIADVGVESFALPIKSLQVSIAAGVFFAWQVQPPPEFNDNFLFAGLMAVTVQREVAQVPIVEPLFDNFQRGGLLAHKQDGLAVGQAFGNDVGDCLALACSRRTVEDKAGSRLDCENCFELAGVAWQYGVQFRGMDFCVESRGRGNRHGEWWWCRIIASNPATVLVLGYLGCVPSVVVIHRELLKTELDNRQPHDGERDDQ